jgi:hypothetical protein
MRRMTRAVFVLGPVAVAPERQGQGVGQGLIRHGLAELSARGVDVALTYGDPAYYGRFGFEVITTEVAAAPFRLGFPHGWLGQALDGGMLSPLKGSVTCVDALTIPASGRICLISRQVRGAGPLCAARTFSIASFGAIPRATNRRPAPVRPSSASSATIT